MDQISQSKTRHQLEHLHENRVPELLATLIVCFVLAVTAVILRLVSRRLNRAQVQSDDYMILIALAFVTGSLVVNLLAIHNGAGRHVILLMHPVLYLKICFANSILYLVGISTIKFSILLFYRGIFGVSHRFNFLSWALGFFILAYTIAGIFVVVFQCDPVHGFWDITVKATCINFSVPVTTLASFNVITDFLTLALPLPLIWKLHMSRGRKLQTSGIFLLGGLVCIGSIYRAIIIYRMSQPDASWPDVDPQIWAMVEMNIGIVSACLPTLRPVIHWIAHGGTYEKRESEGHLQKRLSGIKSKRGPLSWLLPSSLMLSQSNTEMLAQKESTEEAERV